MADHRDLWRGLRCIWLHKPRGGYGYVLRVPVTVQDVTAKRVKVLVEDAGKSVFVSPESLAIQSMRHVEASVERAEAPR